jgi:uncharacterized membrane protein YcaP (DUF421 family)
MNFWKRILLGEAPAAFLLEVLARTAAVYLVLVLLVRMLGKRMSGQISNIELSVMVVLGAIVSGAFQLPDRGVLPALMLMLTLLALQRGVSAGGARWLRFERLTQGGSKMLIKDGHLQLDEMSRIGLSHEQIFAALRGNGVRHLGQVKRLYLEVSGSFALFRQQPEQPGLCVLPTWDTSLARRLTAHAQLRACARCGTLRSSGPEAPTACQSCGERELQPAMLEPPEPSTVQGDACQPDHGV